MSEAYSFIIIPKTFGKDRIETVHRMPLLVHFVFHPDSQQARQLAINLHKSLNNDTIVPGVDIPTVFCDCSQQSPPADQQLDRAERSFVVVLADDYLVAGDNAQAWHQFVFAVWNSARTSPHRFVPIQLSENAWGFSDELTRANISFGRAFHTTSAEQQCEVVGRVIATELCRFLANKDVGTADAKAPVKFFLSHAKHDLNAEPRVFEELKKTLTSDQPVEAWVDSGDIAAGDDFATAIQDGIKESSILAILTDNYATREWCRTEILLAKEHQRPIVVVDALQEYEVRSFPYLGNVPVIRWIPGKPYRTIDLLIKESVRHAHTRLRLENWRKDGDLIIVRAPELATIANVSQTQTLLYPDPPLGSEEARLLERIGVTATTPLERMATEHSLDGKQIAVSMSESSDIDEYGFAPLHLDNTVLELSRYLLIKGATLAYGGHLGAAGFTEKLFELVRAHNQIDRVGSVKPITNYVGWPLPEPDIKKKSEFFQVGKFQRVQRPDNIDESLHGDFKENPKFFPAETSSLHRFAWSLGMTKMREVQTANTCARIVLGGKSGKTLSVGADGAVSEKWYASRIPGLLEEVYVSAKANQPVFLIGAYGGAAAMVIDLIEGRDREEATWEYQKAAPHSQELKQLYADHGIQWDSYEEIITFLRNKGIAGINPLLTEEENRELFRTIDLMRMVELVLKGLAAI